MNIRLSSSAAGFLLGFQINWISFCIEKIAENDRKQSQDEKLKRLRERNCVSAEELSIGFELNE